MEAGIKGFGLLGLEVWSLGLGFRVQTLGVWVHAGFRSRVF